MHATQQYLQPTQIEAPQFTVKQAIVENLWGFLLPHDPNLPVIKFHRDQHEYLIGRGDATFVNKDSTQFRNDYILKDARISNIHCSIRWNGYDDARCRVYVWDHSTNGTYIGGKALGYPQLPRDNPRRAAMLQPGDVISFASPDEPQGIDPTHQDNRYTFYNVADVMNVSMIYPDYI